MSDRDSLDEIAWIRSLDRASGATTPGVDVASAVMRELRRSQQIAATDAGLPTLAAALASLAGAVAATVAVVVWLGMQDPLIDLIEPLRLVLQ